MAPAATRQMSAAPRRRSCAARRTAGASTSRTPAASARGPGREGSLGIARPAIIWKGVRRLQTRATERIRAFAYPLGWRIAGALLFAVSRASLPAILALVVLATDPPVTPPMLMRAVVVLALLPGLAARLVARAFVASLSVDDDALVIRRRDLRLEVPYRAVARLAPWAVPLPGPGLSVWMQSGRRLRQGLQIDDPTPLSSPSPRPAGSRPRAQRRATRSWSARTRGRAEHPGVGTTSSVGLPASRSSRRPCSSTRTSTSPMAGCSASTTFSGSARTYGHSPSTGSR